MRHLVSVQTSAQRVIIFRFSPFPPIFSLRNLEVKAEDWMVSRDGQSFSTTSFQNSGESTLIISDQN